MLSEFLIQSYINRGTGYEIRKWGGYKRKDHQALICIAILQKILLSVIVATLLFQMNCTRLAILGYYVLGH